MLRIVFIIVGLALLGSGWYVLYGDAAHEIINGLERRDRWFSVGIALIGAGLYMVVMSLRKQGLRIFPGSK
jgi:hypothetical protein